MKRTVKPAAVKVTKTYEERLESDKRMIGYQEDWVRRGENSLLDSIKKVATRLRLEADDLERKAAYEGFFNENQYSNFQTRTQEVIHDIVWMTANLNLDGLLREATQLAESKAQLKYRQPVIGEY